MNQLLVSEELPSSPSADQVRARPTSPWPQTYKYGFNSTQSSILNTLVAYRYPCAQKSIPASNRPTQVGNHPICSYPAGRSGLLPGLLYWPKPSPL
jgi:hypothetical protein